MTPRLRLTVTAAAALAVLLATSACASAPDAPRPPGDDASTSTPPPASIAAPGQVWAQGTVLQKDGEDPQLCLGPIMESYPPQCSGLPMSGWAWDASDGAESASGVTWGAYGVWGGWDGTTFSVDDAVPLALLDPMPIDDPLLDPDNAGDTPDEELLAIQERLTDESPFPNYGSWTQNGYLFVQVDYDDGSYQDWVDAEFGPDTVAIHPSLRDV